MLGAHRAFAAAVVAPLDVTLGWRTILGVAEGALRRVEAEVRATVFGFGGVREYDGRLSIAPHLPAAWRSLSFSLRVGDRQLRVELAHDGDRYTIEGGALDLEISGVEHRLVPGRELSLAPSAA